LLDSVIIPCASYKGWECPYNCSGTFGKNIVAFQFALIFDKRPEGIQK